MNQLPWHRHQDFITHRSSRATMLRLKKRRSRVVASGATMRKVPRVPNDTQARLCALGKMAREKLAPWAAVELPDGIEPGMRAHDIPLGKGIFMPGHPFAKEFKKAGEHEGLGILLIIAKLDADGDGKVSPAEMKDFCDNIQSMAENEMGFATTVMIVSTLSLAITVPLVVLQPYDWAPSDWAVLGVGWPGVAAWYTAWMTSPALLVVHWLELLFLAASILKSVESTLLAMAFYAALSLYCPDTESKAGYMFDNSSLLAQLGYSGAASLVYLLLGLTFLSARVSPFAGLFIGPLFLLTLRTFFWNNVFKGVFMAPALNQFRMARDVLSLTKDRHAPDRQGQAEPQPAEGEGGQALVVQGVVEEYRG